MTLTDLCKKNGVKIIITPSTLPHTSYFIIVVIYKIVFISENICNIIQKSIDLSFLQRVLISSMLSLQK